jgi:hypothetical protein
MEAGLSEQAREFDREYAHLVTRYSGQEFAQAVKKLANKYVRITVR